jgi:hypothetical protein
MDFFSGTTVTCADAANTLAKTNKSINALFIPLPPAGSVDEKLLQCRHIIVIGTETQVVPATGQYLLLQGSSALRKMRLPGFVEAMLVGIQPSYLAGFSVLQWNEHIGRQCYFQLVKQVDGNTIVPDGSSLQFFLKIGGIKIADEETDTGLFHQVAQHFQRGLKMGFG